MEIIKILSWLASNYELVENLFAMQYTSYSLIFSSLHSVLNGEQHEKHLYKQSSHYRKHRMFNRQTQLSI